MKKIISIILLALIIGIITLFSYTPALPENHGKLDLKLYLPDDSIRAMIVGFGGSEGGNSWTSNRWSDIRQKFLNKGYAFLSIGYFGTPSTPDVLDRISLNAINDSIQSIVNRHQLNPSKIGLIGGSKGGELVLNLASHYPVYSAVIAIVPAHISFPAHTPWMNTSSWTLNNEGLDFVPATFEVFEPLLNNQLGEAFKTMLKDTSAVAAAHIPVERIKGSILLLSADEDEQWPSTFMSNEIMQRLSDHEFSYPYDHFIIPGNHTAPLQHFDSIFHFLDQHPIGNNATRTSAFLPD